MRRTFEQTKDSLEFLHKVEQLSPEQRDHMRRLVELIIDCYLDDDKHAVLVAGSDTSEYSTLLTVNCDEMQASITLSKLKDLFMDLNQADAPSKELLN